MGKKVKSKVSAAVASGAITFGMVNSVSSSATSFSKLFLSAKEKISKASSKTKDRIKKILSIYNTSSVSYAQNESNKIEKYYGTAIYVLYKFFGETGKEYAEEKKELITRLFSKITDSTESKNTDETAEKETLSDKNFENIKDEIVNLFRIYIAHNKSEGDATKEIEKKMLAVAEQLYKSNKNFGTMSPDIGNGFAFYPQGEFSKLNDPIMVSLALPSEKSSNSYGNAENDLVFTFFETETVKKGEILNAISKEIFSSIKPENFIKEMEENAEIRLNMISKIVKMIYGNPKNKKNNKEIAKKIIHEIMQCSIVKKNRKSNYKTEFFKDIKTNGIRKSEATNFENLSSPLDRIQAFSKNEEKVVKILEELGYNRSDFENLIKHPATRRVLTMALTVAISCMSPGSLQFGTVAKNTVISALLVKLLYLLRSDVKPSFTKIGKSILSVGAKAVLSI